MMIAPMINNKKLNKSKVAIFSDLHLGIHGNSEEWHKISLDWCEWIVKSLQDKKIRDIFFLGDFFDNRSEISVQTIHVASEIMEKLSSFNIFMIVGNHDAFYKNRSDVHSLGLMRGYPNVKIIDDNFIIDQFDKQMLFVPWNNPIPDGNFDYIFGHFEIQTFKMNNFKVCDHGFTPFDLVSKGKNIFSGHFHTKSSKQYKNSCITYVGNTFPMDFSDVDDEKGYYILDIEHDDLKFISNIISPRYKKVLISEVDKLKKDDIQNNFIKLIIDSDLEESKLDEIKLKIGKDTPHTFLIEHNFTKTTINNVEDIDSIEISSMMDEFISQLKLESNQEERIKQITSELYLQNK
jgi:DNA repair exonuclease SbcCD nuclease subunit